jgi:hypothetical protein
MVYKPQMPFERPKPLDEYEDEAPPIGVVTRDPEEDRVPEVDSVFSIQPPNGILEPAQAAEFRITFAPPVVVIFISLFLFVCLFLFFFHSTQRL